MVVITLLLPLSSAGAQEPPPAGTAPAPLANTGTVVMVSQTVDASLATAEDGTTWADVTSNVRLHQTNKTQTVDATFGWPAWAGGATTFSPEGLTNFSVTRGGQQVSLSPREYNTDWGGGEARTVPWWETTQSFGRDERVSFQASWRQSLGAGPLVTFRFGLVPAGRWPGAVGSIRVTVDLPRFTQAEQIIAAQPAEMEFDGERVEWVLTDVEPAQNIELTLIAPPLWTELQALRDRVAANADDGDAWLRLAEIYTALSGAGVTGYEAETRSALLEARRASPDSPETHRRLWHTYRDEVGDPPDLATLQVAITHAQALVETGDGEEEARTYVVDGYRRLADAWMQQNSPELALSLLDEAARYATGETSAAVAEEHRAAAEQLALTTMVRSGLSDAIAVASEYDLPHDVSRPWLDGITVRVETDGSGRRLLAELDSAVSQPQFAANLDELGNALQQNAPADAAVTWNADAGAGQLEITMNRTEPEYWLNTSHALLAAVPDDPSLDSLRSALQPQQIEWRRTEDWLQERVLYRETVSLSGRAIETADALQVRREETDSSWEAALVGAATDAWQQLAANQRVRYVARFDVGGRTLQHEWDLAVPASDTLTFQTETPRIDNWILLGAGGVVLLLVVLTVIWRWPLRR